MNENHIITQEDISNNPELAGQVEVGDEVELGPQVDVTSIARVCHETNRAYCATIGDFSQKPWDEAEEWQRQSAIKGVEYRLLNADAPASAQHEAWMADKVADGWVYGEVKDAEKKTHPCIVSYDELPFEQRRKDYLFQAVVDALTKE